MTKLGLFMCALVLGCGDTQAIGSPGDDVGDDFPTDDVSGDVGDDLGEGGRGGGNGDNGDASGRGGTGGSGPKGGPDSQASVYLFDCDTIAGGIEDLPIEIEVSPSEHFATGTVNSVTLSGSITLDQETVAGIAERGVDIVDVNESRVTVRVSGATPTEVDLPGPTIPGFDLLADTDDDDLAGPHTFAVGPVVVEITPIGGSAVGFAIDIDSMQLSLAGVPIVGSIDIPEFCRSRALHGEAITFDLTNGGIDGQGGVGGAGGEEGAAACDRSRLFDDGEIFDGSLRERLCEWSNARGR